MKRIAATSSLLLVRGSAARSAAPQGHKGSATKFGPRMAIVLIGAALAACSSPPTGGSVAPRGFAFAPPAGCSMTRGEAGSECRFTTSDDRRRKVMIRQNPQPIATAFNDPAAVRASIQRDGESYWEYLVLAWEARAVSAPSLEVRRADAQIRNRRQGPAGAQACVQFVYDVTGRQSDGTLAALDNEGLRCVLYDPAADVIEEFVLEYEEMRPLTRPRASGFSEDAESVMRSLRFSASDA